jgi:hypothetical protein
MKPAEYVIKAFGGVRVTARLLKLSPSTVSRWQRTGFIPGEHHVPILKAAKKCKLDITAEHLVYGGRKK